jgi:hypothetical protein
VKVKEIGNIHPNYLATVLGYWAMEHQLATVQDVQDIGGDNDNDNDSNNANATTPSNSYQISYST